jgi:hypothetical protein
MTDQTTLPTQFTPAPQSEAPKKKRWFTRPVVVLPIATLVLGLGLGMNNRPDPVTITNTVEKPVDRIIKQDVKVTPVACLTALDLAEQGFTYSAEALGYTNEALQAASRLNVAGVNAATEKMKVLNPKISAMTGPMTAAKAQCRASAK